MTEKKGSKKIKEGVEDFGTIGKKLEELKSSLNKKVRELERSLATKIGNFILETGILVDSIELIFDDNDGNDFAPGDDDIDLDVHVVLSK